MGYICTYIHTRVPLFRISGTAGRIVLKFAKRVEGPNCYMSRMWYQQLLVHNFVVHGTHSAEIWCVVRPLSYAFYTTMSAVYLHVRKSNCF